MRSTTHAKYRCQYRMVFVPGYRQKEAYPFHIYIIVSIPPYLSLAQFIGFLKGKSSLMIFDRYADLKYRYESGNFWHRRYYVDTAGCKKAIAEYMRTQLEEGCASG